MAGSPCPIEVMKQVLTKLHMPQVTVNTEWLYLTNMTVKVFSSFQQLKSSLELNSELTCSMKQMKQNPSGFQKNAYHLAR